MGKRLVCVLVAIGTMISTGIGARGQVDPDRDAAFERAWREAIVARHRGPYALGGYITLWQMARPAQGQEPRPDESPGFATWLTRASFTCTQSQYRVRALETSMATDGTEGPAQVREYWYPGGDRFYEVTLRGAATSGPTALCHVGHEPNREVLELFVKGLGLPLYLREPARPPQGTATEEDEGAGGGRHEQAGDASYSSDHLAGGLDCVLVRNTYPAPAVSESCRWVVPSRDYLVARSEVVGNGGCTARVTSVSEFVVVAGRYYPSACEETYYSRAAATSPWVWESTWMAAASGLREVNVADSLFEPWLPSGTQVSRTGETEDVLEGASVRQMLNQLRRGTHPWSEQPLLLGAGGAR